MLDKSKYTSIKEKYLYSIIITVIVMSTFSATIRLYINDYIIVLGDLIMIFVILSIAHSYEKNADFSQAVIRIFWLSNIIIFVFIVYSQYSLFILLIVLMPLLASVLLDVKLFLLHGSIFVCCFFFLMLYGFLNKADYYLLNDVNFIISFTILFIFVLVHSILYNKTYLQLQKSNEQKAFLLKEIHHRVKNNLNIVASILGLEKFESDAEEVHKLINQNKLRIESIAMVHEILYESSDLERIDFKAYIQKLTKHILYTESENGNIEVTLDIVPLRLNIEPMMQFGIIINELMTNSIKYAFEEGKGKIDICLAKYEYKYKLTYKDNGIGLQGTKKGFGSSLIEISVQQLDGELKIISQNGLVYEISFLNTN